jgi:hypothetical protein
MWGRGGSWGGGVGGRFQKRKKLNQGKRDSTVAANGRDKKGFNGRVNGREKPDRRQPAHAHRIPAMG